MVVSRLRIVTALHKCTICLWQTALCLQVVISDWRGKALLDDRSRYSPCSGMLLRMLAASLLVAVAVLHVSATVYYGTIPACLQEQEQSCYVASSAGAQRWQYLLPFC